MKLLSSLTVLGSSLLAVATRSAATAAPAAEGIPSTSNNNNDVSQRASPPAGPLPAVEEASSDSAASDDDNDYLCTVDGADGTSCSASADDSSSPLMAPRHERDYYCVDDNPINRQKYQIFRTLNCFEDVVVASSSSTNGEKDSKVVIGDFVSPRLEPGQVAPILWRHSVNDKLENNHDASNKNNDDNSDSSNNDESVDKTKDATTKSTPLPSLGGKIVTQHAYQIGLPPTLITTLLNYCNSMGITDAFRQFTLDPHKHGGKPIPASSDHDGKFIQLNDKNENDQYQWYAQRPAQKWKSNMHWISPANEKTHEAYLKVLGRGDFDLVLQSIGEQLALEGLVAYHLTFIGVSHSVRGFLHHDSQYTGGKVYNIIIPLLLEEDVDPELILLDDGEEQRRGGFKYQVGTAVMMGDDAMHGTLECDYRNINSTHFRDGKIGGMRMAATVYVADVNQVNVEKIASETLTQIFPLADTDWLMAQRGRHWRKDGGDGGNNTSYSIANDVGRKPFRFDDEFDECFDNAEDGLCESDTELTRKQCLKSCSIYIQEGPFSTRLVTSNGKEDDGDGNDGSKLNDVEVCTQNRTGGEECKIYLDDTSIAGDFIIPKLEPGDLFPILWRDDNANRTTEYAFQIGLPPELTEELLNYCNRLGVTDLFRSLVGDNPIQPKDNDHAGQFFELSDGNRWFAQRPAKFWTSNMHWVSPADEQTHEEYLKVLAKGNFDLVLDAIGKYLGLEGLVAYHLTFIGVSHSDKGYMHRDTHHTGGSVYNVIIPLILEEDALPELAIADDYEEDRIGKLKYQLGAAAMMGDDAMHGTEACDYREKKGMRMAATIYIADINEKNAMAISKQTLTQIFPPPDSSWLMAQKGRHWDGVSGSKSLLRDKGRKSFLFYDKWDDCVDRAEMCESDTSETRVKCLRSCKIYESDLESDNDNVERSDDIGALLEVCSLDELGKQEECRWTNDSNLSDTIVIPKLKSGEIFGLRWKQDGKKASQNSYQVALPPSLTTELLKYCEETEITRLFRSLLSNETMDPGQGHFTDLKDGNRWHVQRQSNRTRDNDMHILSPSDEVAHERFLDVLAKGDFDSTLIAIGNFLKLGGLAVYQTSIIGLSYAEEGCTHHNFTETEGSVYNVIIPLVIENNDPPIFVIKHTTEGGAGEYKVQLGNGLIMGDGSIHGIAKLDYRKLEGIVLAASIYIADIREDNTEVIIKQTLLSQPFPPPDKDFLWAQRGRHWGYSSSLWDDDGGEPIEARDKLDDCSDRVNKGMCESDVDGTRFNCPVSCGVFAPDATSIIPIGRSPGGLPQVRFCIKTKIGRTSCKTYDDVDTPGSFITPYLGPCEMFPIVWREDGKQAHKNLWKFGLPAELSNKLRAYIDHLGIIDHLHVQIYEPQIDPAKIEIVHFGRKNLKWYVQQPQNQLKSDEHITYPADEEAHEDIIRVLGEGNFDQILAAIGSNMDLTNLAVYHVAFSGTSHSVNGTIAEPYTVRFSGNKAFSVVIPLVTSGEKSSDLLIVQDSEDENQHGAVKFENDVGLILGDGLKHGKPEFDYRNGLQLIAIVYVAEMDAESTDAIVNSLDRLFPPSDKTWTEAQAGRHWGGRSSMKNDQGRLPYAVVDKLDDCPRLAGEGKCNDDFEGARQNCFSSCNVLSEYTEGEYVDRFFDNLKSQNDDTCVDLSPFCKDEAKIGLCMTDRNYMEEKGCHRSCLYCLRPDSRELLSIGIKQVLQLDKSEEEYEEEEDKPDEDEEGFSIPSPREVADVLATTEDYFVNVVLVNDDYKHVRLSCRNYNEKCSYWAAQGHCEASPGWMGKNCAAACMDCFMVDWDYRCPIDYESNAVGSGDIGGMFKRWIEEAGSKDVLSSDNPPVGKFEHPFGQLSVLSSPYNDMNDYLTEEEKNSDEVFQPLPWVVSIDGFLSEEECDKLIEFGATQGYERSTEYGTQMNIDGSYDFVESAGRTSTNSWCQGECAADPVVKGVVDRMAIMTGIPPENYEDIQLVRYEHGQFYEDHHDYSASHEGTQYGPRLLTFFLYLNDVETGGGTKFRHLNLTVQPKRGMALVWPSVSDEDVDDMDDWTWHEALSVVRGVKYGANTWIHLRNFQDSPDYC